MVRLLDNLPEKDSNTTSQCTSPSTQSFSVSLREVHSADSMPRNLPLMSNPTKPTSVPSLALYSDSDGSSLTSYQNTPRDVTYSVQSLSTTSQLHISVCEARQSRLLNVSANYSTSTYVTVQNGSYSTTNSQLSNICLASQEPGWSPSATITQLPHSRLDVSITRDIPPSCISVPSSSSQDGLSCITVPSKGRSGPSCITTPSSSGRGGLSAYDNRPHHVHSASSAPQSYGQSHVSNRPPPVSSDRQRPLTIRSAAAYSDWITTRY